MGKKYFCNRELAISFFSFAADIHLGLAEILNVAVTDLDPEMYLGVFRGVDPKNTSPFIIDTIID